MRRRVFWEVVSWLFMFGVLGLVALAWWLVLH